jgi:adenine phosphoribosyltransferase
MSAILASNSFVKIRAITNILVKHDIGLLLVNYEDTTKVKTPEQPIGDYTIQCALTRIKNVETNKSANSDLIIAIENGIKKMDNVWYDFCIVLIKNTHSGKVYSIKNPYLIKIPDQELVEEMDKKYSKDSPDGWPVTVGEKLAAKYKVDPKNWMKDLVKIDRATQISSSVPSLSDIVRDIILNTIREIPDHPKKGVLFKDLMPLLYNPIISRLLTKSLINLTIEKSFDMVAGPELRGCIFGPLIAQKLNVGFVPLRKPGKLPPPVLTIEYGTEYSNDKLEIDNSDYLELKGKSVLLVDDVLATGGSLKACINLLEQKGVKYVEWIVVQDVPELRKLAEEKLKGYNGAVLLE